MDALDLVAKIKMDLEEYEKGLDTAKKKAESAGSGMSKSFGKVASGIGKTMATVAKATAAATAAAAAGVTALASQAVGLYGEYEQMEGGIKKLFGTGGQSIEEYAKSVGKAVDEVTEEYGKLESSFNAVMDNASKAWTTAGRSANDYMKTVTSISGALIGALDGDKAAAAEYADRAVVQMSDIANTFGYTVDEISEKYKSISRGMYQTLDDLTAGAYAGNKTGFQKLIDDMAELTDIQKDLNLEVKSGEYDYANFVNAMEVFNTKMGVAGTTAKEATETIQGSLNSLKAAWTNLLTGMGDKNADFTALMDNLVTALVGKTEKTVDQSGVIMEKHTKGFLDNIMPILEQTLTGIGTLIETLVPKALDLIPTLLNDVLPKITSAATSLVEGLTQTLSENMSKISSVISQVVGEIVKLLPEILVLVGQLVGALGTAVMDNLDTILEAAGKIIEILITGLGQNAEKITAAAVLIISKLVSFIAENAQLLIQGAVAIMNGIMSGLLENMDLLIEAGISLAMALFEGLLQALPELLSHIGEFIEQLISTILDHTDEIYDAATTLFLELVKALPDIMIALGNALEAIFTGIANLMTGEGSSEIFESALMMFLEIVAALPQVAVAALGALWELLNALGQALTQAGANMLSLGLEMFGKINEALKQVATNILSTIATTVQGWINAFMSTVSQWKSAGLEMINGLWAGIKGKFDDVVGKVKSMAASLPAAVKKVLGIASPSKVFKEIGANMVYGLEKGWDDNIDDASKNMTKELDNMTSSLDASLGLNASSLNTVPISGQKKEPVNITLYATTTMDGKKVGESTFEYTTDKINSQERAMAVATGGYY